MSALRKNTVVAASVVFTALAQPAVAQKDDAVFAKALVEMKADIARMAPLLAARSAVHCQDELDSKGPYSNKQIAALFEMKEFTTAHPAKTYDVRNMMQYMLDTERYYCFDNRLSGKPYASVLYFNEPVTGINPTPLDGKRPAYALQAALFDAAEHLYGVDRLLDMQPQTRAKLTKPSFVRLDLNRLADSKKSVVQELVPEFYFSPAKKLGKQRQLTV